jgi:hypothetical protein
MKKFAISIFLCMINTNVYSCLCFDIFKSKKPSKNPKIYSNRNNVIISPDELSLSSKPHRVWDDFTKEERDSLGSDSNRAFVKNLNMFTKSRRIQPFSNPVDDENH